MIRVPAASFLILLISISSISKTPAKQAKATKTEQRIAQLERDWSAAFLRHDVATIDRIIADDYVGTDGRGIISNKAQELEEARPPRPGDPAPPFEILDEAVTDIKVRSYGDLAIANGRVIEKIKTKEGEAEIQYRRTTVWVNRRGRWQCVSFHGSRILTPPAAR
jgi:ketosteroid isomerase-like protein